MLYLKLYTSILTELNTNNVNFILIDRQKLGPLKMYTYVTVKFIFVEIEPSSTNIKNAPCTHM